MTKKLYETTKQSVLYVAFHYPPILGSSGVHRTLAFTRHLAEQGWQVNVLTASIKAYDKWSEQQLSFIPEKVNVIRAFARNTARSFSFKGKYLSWLAQPDNWQSWIIPGIFSGLWQAVKEKPKVIISTYPIASAHIIAYVIHRLTGIPWVADLRDPMAQDDYPTDATRKKIFEWIERKAVKHCKHIVFTAPGAVSFYKNKFPQAQESLWKLIPNGFDARMFDNIEWVEKKKDLKKVTLLHSGVIYPSERDPSVLFNALSELKKSGVIHPENINITLRATGHDQLYQPILEELDIADVVILAPPIPYKEALAEMNEVDALLLLQADNCDFQIPAKAYEYLKVKKPILALTSQSGDTGQLLLKTGVALVASLTDKQQIKDNIVELLNRTLANEGKVLTDSELEKYSRQYHAKSLEALLQQL